MRGKDQTETLTLYAFCASSSPTPQISFNWATSLYHKQSSSFVRSTIQQKAKRMTVAEAVKSVPDLVSLTCRSFYGHNSETTALTFRELYRIFTGDRQITHLTHVKVRVVLHLSRE